MAMDPRAGSGIAGDSLVHHLNMTADMGKGDLATYSGCEFIFSLSEEVSKQFIYVFQDFFQATNLGRVFNTKLKKVNKEVIIQDEFSADTQLFPQVVVKSVPVDHLPVSLGNRLGTQTEGNQLFEVFGGLCTMNVSMDIYDSGKANTCALADVIFLSLMQYVPARLGEVNIVVQPQVKFTGVTKVNGAVVGGEVYRLTLNVTVNSNWKQYLEIETVDTSSFETQSSVDGGKHDLETFAIQPTA